MFCQNNEISIGMWQLLSGTFLMEVELFLNKYYLRPNES